MSDRYREIMKEASGQGSYHFKRIIATRLKELCEAIDGLESELFEFGCANPECPASRGLFDRTSPIGRTECRDTDRNMGGKIMSISDENPAPDSHCFTTVRSD